MSRIKVDAIETTSGVPKYLTAAWASVNQVTSTSVLGSGGVTSVTDTSTGRFNLNLTNALPDASYSWSGNAKRADTSNVTVISQYSTDPKTTTVLGLTCHQGSWTLVDFPDTVATVTR